MVDMEIFMTKVIERGNSRFIQINSNVNDIRCIEDGESISLTNKGDTKYALYIKYDEIEFINYRFNYYKSQYELQVKKKYDDKNIIYFQKIDNNSTAIHYTLQMVFISCLRSLKYPNVKAVSMEYYDKPEDFEFNY